MTEILCVCGHAAEPHTHHRDGRDCSRCGRELCPEFRPLTWWRRALNRCGWYPAPLPDPALALDLASLFTPARFQVKSPSAGPEPVLSPEQWEQITRDLLAERDEPEQWTPPPDVDGRPIEVGDWVEMLDPPFGIGEVVEAFGAWCEVRVPPGERTQAEYGTRLRVIAEEES